MVVVWLLLIGSVWGTTNAFIKRGAFIAQEKEKRRKEKRQAGENTRANAFRLVPFVEDWIHLLSVWEYSIPFLVNLSASILFFKKLGDSPINIAVPVTNATTFAVTAIAGAALGERIEVPKAMLGIALIVVGIVLCIAPGIMTKDG